MTDSTAAQYLAGLPEVETSRLPKGTLFHAQGRLYEVIETGNGGYHRAREWRRTEETDVALIPGSFLSKYLTVVRRGRLLPVYRTRLELTQDDQPTCYVFPIESLALDAAYLDVALIQSPGAYVRNQGSDAAFAVTDGVHVFRLYYYRQSTRGRKADLSSLQARPLAFKPRPHTDGPGYWRLLPTWTEMILDLDVTQPMKPITNSLEDTSKTLPHTPTVGASDS